VTIDSTVIEFVRHERLAWDEHCNAHLPSLTLLEEWQFDSAARVAHQQKRLRHQRR
jgi:hypothetical protein